MSSTTTVSHRSEKVQQLTEMLRRFERSSISGAGRESAGCGSKLQDAASPLGAQDGVISTGIDALDRLLPAGGIRPGSLMEWLTAASGTGAGTLALIAVRFWLQAAHQAELPGACVFIESRPRFYPPALATLGISLEQLILVRPQRPEETLWAAEQSLRCPGVSLVWIELGHCRERVSRRLQLAAEVGGAVGLLFRPWSVHRHPSWAEVRLGVSALPTDSKETGRRMRVERLYGRGCAETQAIELNIHDETGVVSVVPQLADSALASERRRA